MTTQTQGSGGEGGQQGAQGQAAPAAGQQVAAPAVAAPAAAPAPAVVPLSQYEELKASNLKLQESMEQQGKRWETLQGFFKNPDAAPAELPPQAAAMVSQAVQQRDLAWRSQRATQLAVTEDAHDPFAVAQLVGGSKAFAVNEQGDLKDQNAARAELTAFKARNPWAFRQAAAVAAAQPAAAAGGAVTPAPGMVPSAAQPTGTTPPAPVNENVRNAGFMPMSALRDVLKQ